MSPSLKSTRYNATIQINLDTPILTLLSFPLHNFGLIIRTFIFKNDPLMIVSGKINQIGDRLVTQLYQKNGQFITRLITVHKWSLLQLIFSMVNPKSVI